jgi:hypothetical protein
MLFISGSDWFLCTSPCAGLKVRRFECSRHYLVSEQRGRVDRSEFGIVISAGTEGS